MISGVALRDTILFKEENFAKKRLEDTYFEKDEVVVNPNRVCRTKGCRSNEFYVRSVQTRRGDEGMTTYFTCVKCGVKTSSS